MRHSIGYECLLVRKASQLSFVALTHTMPLASYADVDMMLHVCQSLCSLIITFKEMHHFAGMSDSKELHRSTDMPDSKLRSRLSYQHFETPPIHKDRMCLPLWFWNTFYPHTRNVTTWMVLKHLLPQRRHVTTSVVLKHLLSTKTECDYLYGFETPSVHKDRMWLPLWLD